MVVVAIDVSEGLLQQHSQKQRVPDEHAEKLIDPHEESSHDDTPAHLVIHTQQFPDIDCMYDSQLKN